MAEGRRRHEERGGPSSRPNEEAASLAFFGEEDP
jgi:hypothetical protein